MESKKESTPHVQGILRHSSGDQHQHQKDHVHFDEQVIIEHDEERGTRMKIDEPKTPYNEGYTGDDQPEQEDVHMESLDKVQMGDDSEVRKHLEEAERNKLLNA